MTVTGWTCPECGRVFGRNHQQHDCSPGLSLEEYFASGPPHERAIFEAVMRHVTTIGPVHLDIVSVGIFLKNPRKFAELRPKDHWVAVAFSLSRSARHRTITRKVVEYGGKYWHVANVRSPADVDEALCDLLTEAYELAGRSPRVKQHPG